MALSSDLLSQFAKLTKPEKDTNTETTVYGVAVKYNNALYVRLDGSELLTPVATTTDTKDGERVIVRIKNHSATITGNVSSPSARNRTVQEISAKTDETSNQITDVEILIADKVSTDDFDTQVARIDSLQADNVVIKDLLSTSGADIGNLTATYADITKRLTAAEADIDDLETTKLDAEVATITYATITDLEATDANLHNLESTYADFEVATTNRFTAVDATIKNLDSKYATISDLNVERGRINVLEANSLTASSAVITDLQADVADIDTLIFGSASGDVIQTSFANAVIAQLGNAQIKTAMIESISADKIISGDIITNNVRVMSEDGKLLISDETIQISDATRVRVQIGKDAAGDYSINIWDTAGNLMFSEGGITDNAIKQAIIRDDMVSDTANISANKLNIESLFEVINGSTKTIKSSRIMLDSKGQTLDVVFSDLSTQVDGLDKAVSSQGTSLSVVQGQISSKVWQADIDDATGEMNTKYSTLEQEVDKMNVVIASHTTELGNKAENSTVNAVIDQVTELEVDLTGFKSTVSDTYATKTEMTKAQTAITQNAEEIQLRATNTQLNNVSKVAQEAYNNTLLQSDVTNYAQLNDNTTSKWGFTADETADGHWYTMNVLSRDKFISGWHLCNGGERFRISFEISTSCKGNTTSGGTDSAYRGTAIGLYSYDAEGTSVGISYSDRVMASADAPVTSVSSTVTVSSKARKFRVFVQTESYGNFSGSIKIRNIRVEKIDKTLETIVHSNQTKITQNSESITAVSERTAANESDISSLELTSNGLITRVSSTEKDVETALVNAANAQADIDGLEIGGRNLYENSGNLSSECIGRYFAPEVPPYTITIEEDSSIPSGNCIVCAIGEAGTAITNGGFYLNASFGNHIPKMTEGETYTVSIWAKCSRNIGYGAISPEFLTDRVRQDSNNLTTEWQRFIVTGKYNGNTTSAVAITFYYNSLTQSNDVFYFSSPQIEKGNRATDWTPAPEDMATPDEVELVQSSVDLVEERVTTAESLIEQLSDCIAMLVTDGNGESLMTQTENGWTFSTGQIQSVVDATSENLDNLTNEMGDVNSTVGALQQAVNDLGILNDYVKIGTYESEPCIELGESDSDFKLIITNTRIMFMEGSGVPAYINNQSLFINKAVIEEELQQGEFIWKARSNGNLGLIWKGATS